MPLILVDYLTVSMPLDLYGPDGMCEKLGLNREEMTYNEHSKMDYVWCNRCLFLGGIKIHWQEDMNTEKAPLMVLEMSGTGCRLLESLQPDINWIDFMESILSNEGTKISRLDIACDDNPGEGEKGLLSYPTMYRHTKERRYRCLARSRRWVGGDEEILYFSSPKSDRRLRIYNKALERNYDGHWIRVEFQFRKDTALSFYMRALERGSIGEAYYGMLYDYLAFTREVNKSDDHQSRLTVCRWWQKFCNDAKKIKGFYIGGLEYNRDRLEHYIGKQAASSIQTWLVLNQGDYEGLNRLVSDAAINKKQEILIREAAMWAQYCEDKYPAEPEAPVKPREPAALEPMSQEDFNKLLVDVSASCPEWDALPDTSSKPPKPWTKEGFAAVYADNPDDWENADFFPDGDMKF